MQNLKIKVNSKAESKEAQELFFKLGFQWRGLKSPFDLFYPTSMDNYYIVLTKGSKEMQIAGAFRDGLGAWKEITLPELRDMAVLNRNDANDANVYQDGEIPCLYDLYLTDNKELYFYHCSKEKWILSSLSGDQCYYKLLKPIKKEKPMKEWLNTKTFEYKQAVCMFGHSEWIEIPDGMNFAYKDDMYTHFTKMEMGYRDAEIIWQRPQQPEALPFIDDNPQSLCEQYAEIEQVRQQTIEATLAERQSTYGNFEDVAFVTENIMAVLSKARTNGLSDLPHTHRMALYMIASKMARIVNGDFNHVDGWHDIGGYSKLIEKLINGEQ